MKAMLVIKAGNGYAVAPYAGDIPVDFVETMVVAPELKSYSYSPDTVLATMKEFFEPEPVTPLKEAA
jgi:hypothetical protein